MKSIHIKPTLISAMIIWTLGVTAYSLSYLFTVMPDPDLQANWVLSLALIPIVAFGAHIYYRRGLQTNGFVLGAAMFVVAMFLDAIITVPVFVIPHGGNHFTFFTDPGFWLLAVEYILVVAVYRSMQNTSKITQTSQV